MAANDTQTPSELDGTETVLLIQPRYHTNQHPVVKTLQQRGHEVHFLALRSDGSETYELLYPDYVEYSRLFRWLYTTVVEPDSSGPIQQTDDTRLHKFGVPSLGWYYRYLGRVDPDLVIVKGYNVITYLTILLTERFEYDIVFYDQDPVYGPVETSTSRDIATRLSQLRHGDRFVRISPVRGEGDRKYRERSYYLPFVAEPDPACTERAYCPTGTVRLLMIGKFTSPRKNHLPLLEVVDRLQAEYEVSLTMVGSLTDPSDDHYERIQRRVERLGLEDTVDIRTNLGFETVQGLYRDHDVYVLPSRDERAAVSHLEAMAHGLPAICSDTNGTRCYIERGENGYVFDTGDYADLQGKLSELLSDHDRLEMFGRRSYELTREEYAPEQFYRRLSRIIAENF